MDLDGAERHRRELLGVAEFATSGTDLDTARIVAARVAILDGAGLPIAAWDWGSDRAESIVGEVAQTLRTLIAVGIPIVTYDAAAGLTVLDRECRRRRIDPWDLDAPVLDPLVLDGILAPEFDGRRGLNAMAERYGVDPGSLAAGRIVRAMLDHPELAGSAADLHDRQRRLDATWPVLPLDDIRAIEDTQPIPAPPLRPSETVPSFETVPSLKAAPGLDVAGPAAAPRRIHVAAAIVTDTAGRAVVVRKRGTTGFMQPGGKIERGESALAALIRELREELGLEVDVDATEFLGSYEAPALNEPGSMVRAEVFALVTDAELRPAAEIDAIHWLESPIDTGSVELAPLTLDVLLPLWAARRPALF